MAKPKKPNYLPWIVLALLIAGGAFYYFRVQAPPVAVNVTEPGVEVGDLVAIDFVLAMTNGTVVDTNNVSLAEEYNVSAYVKGPFRFVVGQSSKLKGFDEAVLGMRIGETRTKIIEASEPVIEYTINNTRRISRNQPLLLESFVTLSRFEKMFKRKPILNDVIVSQSIPWPIKVTNISERNVVVEALAEEGKSYQLPGLEWKSLLLVKTHNDMLFRHNPEDGQIVTTEFGPTKVTLETGVLNLTYQARVGDIITYDVAIDGPITKPFQFQVTDAAENQFTIRRIHYPPQENLVFTATLLEWEQEVKKTSWADAQE